MTHVEGEAVQSVCRVCDGKTKAEVVLARLLFAVRENS